MPRYLYQVFLEGDIPGPTFEATHSHEKGAFLTHHPITGHRVERLFTPPSLNTRHTPGREQSLKDPQFLKKHGFTRYSKTDSGFIADT